MVLCLSIGSKRIRGMIEEIRDREPAALASRHLCTVEFEVGGGIIGIEIGHRYQFGNAEEIVD